MIKIFIFILYDYLFIILYDLLWLFYTFLGIYNNKIQEKYKINLLFNLSVGHLLQFTKTN